MTSVKNTHWLISLLLALFALGCARQTTPTGGPKDSIPPTLISSSPRQGALNFKGKTIELTFSEAIILNNTREQLIITPGLDKEIDARAKKNQVVLNLDEDLKDNTTYTINFREAVQDITEKNPALMLKLAFSTGNYLDSLSIEGNVYDLLKGTEIKDATIALCESDTFDIFKHKPIYITRSDDKGKFRLENLKPGTYFVYGLEDKNKNLIVDSKTESYGFIRDAFDLSQNIMGISIPFIRLDSRPLKLTSARPDGTYFNIKTSKSLIDYEIKAGDDNIISSFGDDYSNVRIYNTFNDKDSIAARFIAKDSINNKLDSTFYVKFGTRKVDPEPFDVVINHINVIGTKGAIEGKITFSKPVLSINFDSIFYVLDSANRISFTQQDITWDSLRNILFIQKSFDRNLLPKEDAKQPGGGQAQRSIQNGATKKSAKSLKQNQFYFGQSAFISIEHDSSKQISEIVTPTKLEDTGVLIVEIQTSASHFFVELLTKDLQVIKTKRNARKISFEDLKPGDYQIRLIIDGNNNGSWDPGNFYKSQPPEEIFFYRNEKNVPVVNLKANWELGPLLIKH